MQLVLYDHADQRVDLYPLTLTRPIADLRVGILTIAEKWAKRLSLAHSYWTAVYLQKKYPLALAAQEEELLVVSSHICPDNNLCAVIMRLKQGERLVDGQGLIAVRINRRDFHLGLKNGFAAYLTVPYEGHYTRIQYPEDIFTHNGDEIQKDFQLLTTGRRSAELDDTVTVLGSNLFVEEGVQATCCTINTLKGPVYLGKHSEIWEGALIRGPFALGENAQVKMGAKIYGNVTVGPGSRVGGELNTSVIWGNSSKGHEGYLGSSVMGEWCNWGADTNTSNLKNNYKNVKLYHYPSKAYRDTGLQFCGMIMADHAKSAINTAFNTGTVIGGAANVFGAVMPPKFIPDFSWGLGEQAEIYLIDKMFETAKLVFAHRNRNFDTIEQDILREIYNVTQSRKIFNNE